MTGWLSVSLAGLGIATVSGTIGFFVGALCSVSANAEAASRILRLEEETEWHYDAGFKAGVASVSPAPVIPPALSDRMWTNIEPRMKR